MRYPLIIAAAAMLWISPANAQICTGYGDGLAAHLEIASANWVEDRHDITLMGPQLTLPRLPLGPLKQSSASFAVLWGGVSGELVDDTALRLVGGGGIGLPSLMPGVDLCVVGAARFSLWYADYGGGAFSNMMYISGPLKLRAAYPIAAGPARVVPHAAAGFAMGSPIDLDGAANIQDPNELARGFFPVASASVTVRASMFFANAALSFREPELGGSTMFTLRFGLSR